ncbi:hypothetical protein G6F50_014581 [Rhizopus delemar]|uniref:Uncharacterized protein n=1 Tax=Rhizopus delemar TaxID=936053 RepID=A0A9P6Y459_9FUNG|nr:hypothetical protein G6F50_014581 [Rhizopus delemar]
MAPRDTADVGRLALGLHPQLDVAVALAARQRHTGIGGGQPRVRRTQIGTLLRIERTRGGHTACVGPRVVGTETAAVITAEQQRQRVPGVPQIQRRLARGIGHGKIVHRQPRTIDRRHRPGCDLLVRCGHLFGRTLAVGLGNLRPLLRALQAEIGLVQRHLLAAPGIEHFQPGHLQQRVRLADAQRSLATTLPGPTHTQRAVHPLVLPAAGADAMLGADLAAADRQLGCGPQGSGLRIPLHATQLQ